LVAWVFHLRYSRAMNIIETLAKAIQTILQDIGISDIEISFEHPDEMSHGDFSTNVAMRYAKQLGKNPQELAQEIVSKLGTLELVDKVEVAGPGFINFYLSKDYFKQELTSISEDSGKSNIYQGKKILVEHSSPNLFKAFHIGHVMNNTIGESIVRLANFSGASVTAVYYPSDVSLGIGKAIWSLLRKGEDMLDILDTREGKLGFLGKCYVDGTKIFEENSEIQSQVREITRKIYEKEEGREYSAYLKGKEINLEYFLEETKRLGSHFDAFIFESEAGDVGKKIVQDNIPKVFENSDGAVVYKGEDRGLHTRVFINNEGHPTYEAKDIGLFDIKFQRFNPDISILITDNQQTEYYKVVLSAASEIKVEWKEKTIHRTHGRMTFKGKKMSSRLGGVPLASDVLDLISQEAQKKIEDKEDIQRIEAIAIAALKFSILRATAGKNIDFDPETSLSFEGDSGPYLQYTYVRCNSILEKAKITGFEISKIPSEDWKPEALEKLLCRFSETVEQSIQLWEPHHIAGYLLDLAHEFNSWYGQTKILNDTNKNSGFNLYLVQSVMYILKNGLYCLGIEVVERM